MSEAGAQEDSSCDSRTCELCGALENLKLCSACRGVWYCSKEHQRNHWKHHKELCKDYKKFETKRACAPAKDKEIEDKSSITSLVKLESGTSKGMHKVTSAPGMGGDKCNAEVDNIRKRCNSDPIPPSRPLYQEPSSPVPGTSKGDANENAIETEHDEHEQYQQPYTESQSAPHISDDEDDVNQNHKTTRTTEIVDYLLQCLNDYGVCVIDCFLGSKLGNKVLEEVKRLHNTGHLSDGQVVAPEKQGSEKVRSDEVVWIERGEKHCSSISTLIGRVDSLVMQCNPSLEKTKINGRTKAMVACYPGRGTRYMQHVDNAHGDGRRITSIYYLNKDWDKDRDGGILRIFPQRYKTHMVEIEPKFDRLLFFWSDTRNPHEVCPTFRTRYAITVWYFDEVERKRARAKEDIKRRCRHLGYNV